METWEEKLKQAKLNYFKQLIILTELKELFVQREFSGTVSDAHKAVKKRLDFSKLLDHLARQSSSSGIFMLGLTEDYVTDLGHFNGAEINKHSVISELEKHLLNRSKNLVNYYDGSKIPISDNVVEARAVQLPAVFKLKQEMLLAEKHNLRIDQQKRHTCTLKYLEVLMQSFTVLEKLISEYKLRLQSENDKTNVKCLTVRCQTSQLKLRSIELQLLCDTYTAETTRALKQIKNHLNEKQTECERELNTLTKALELYQSIGFGFDQLVAEFAHLMAEHENKMWALQELQGNNSNSPYI